MVEETGDEIMLPLLPFGDTVDGDEKAQRSGGGDIARPGHLCGGAPPARATRERRLRKRKPLSPRYRLPPMTRAMITKVAVNSLSVGATGGVAEQAVTTTAAAACMSPVACPFKLVMASKSVNSTFLVRGSAVIKLS